MRLKPVKLRELGGSPGPRIEELVTGPERLPENRIGLFTCWSMVEKVGVIAS